MPSPAIQNNYDPFPQHVPNANAYTDPRRDDIFEHFAENEDEFNAATGRDLLGSVKVEQKTKRTAFGTTIVTKTTTKSDNGNVQTTVTKASGGHVRVVRPGRMRSSSAGIKFDGKTVFCITAACMLLIQNLINNGGLVPLG